MMRGDIREVGWNHQRPDIVRVVIELPAGIEANKATDGDYLKVKAPPWWHRLAVAMRRKREGD